MQEQKSNEFEDIRPYRDDEVPAVLNGLFSNPIFCSVFWLGLKAAESGWNLSPKDIRKVNDSFRQIKNAKNVDEFQWLLKEPVEGLIKRTIDDLTYSGLDNVSKDKNYLFVSNHRDIVMDPALINYILKTNYYNTTAIATGSNLLNNRPIRDLMKLNKIFVIKRGVNGTKEKLNVMNTQSEFIHDYLTNKGSIWIAQREGRAKDGNDFTKSGLINMFSLAGKERGKTLTDTIINMNILPVSISYEYDPLDIEKSRELFDKKNNGRHTKRFLEDISSMRKGIFGYKGRVNVAFGTQITQIDSKRGLAAEIDKQIITNYKIWPSNEVAYKIVKDIPPSSFEGGTIKFLDRREKVPFHLIDIFDEMYANPLINKMKYSNQNTIEA